MHTNKIARDVATNILLATGRGLILLVTLSLLTGALSAVALGIFLFARRLASTVANLVQMGMSQTLVRYIPIYLDNASAKRRFTMFAFSAATAISILFLLGVGLTSEYLGKLIFPGSGESALVVFWGSVIVVGTVFHFIAYAAFIGETRLFVANALEFMNVSGFLLLILLWNNWALDLLIALKWLGICNLIMGVAATLSYLLTNRSNTPGPAVGWPQLREGFVLYGIPRGGIAFLDMATLTVGPWLIRHDPVATGHLLLAIAVLRVWITATLPVTQILSVVTARLVGTNEQEKISSGFRLLFGTLLYGSMLALAFIAPWGEPLVGFWLNDAATAAAVWSYISVIGLGLVPVVLFYGMRGIIETRWTEPKNLYTITSALVLQVVLYFILTPTGGVEFAIKYSVLSMFVWMGLLTIWWIRDDVLVRNYYGLGKLLLISGLFLIVNMVIQHGLPLEGILLAFIACAATLALAAKVMPLPPFVSHASSVLFAR